MANRGVMIPYDDTTPWYHTMVSHHSKGGSTMENWPRWSQRSANWPIFRTLEPVMADYWGLDVLVEQLIARFGSHCAILVDSPIAINFMRHKCFLAKRIGAVPEEEILNTHKGNVEPSAGDWPAPIGPTDLNIFQRGQRLSHLDRKLFPRL